MQPEKATKFCEISTVDLTGTTQDKSKVVILQKFCGILTKPQLYLVFTPNFKAMIQYFSKNIHVHTATVHMPDQLPNQSRTAHLLIPFIFPSLGQEMVSIVHTDFYPAVNNSLLRSSGQSNLYSDLHMSAYFPLNCQNQEL